MCELKKMHNNNYCWFVFLLLGTVHDIVNRGGRCLIPVFALGRAQELLLILGRFSTLVEPLIINYCELIQKTAK